MTWMGSKFPVTGRIYVYRACSLQKREMFQAIYTVEVPLLDSKASQIYILNAHKNITRLLLGLIPF